MESKFVANTDSVGDVPGRSVGLDPGKMVGPCSGTENMSL